jgi:mono/diheme cytochrome c family protein
MNGFELDGAAAPLASAKLLTRRERMVADRVRGLGETDPRMMAGEAIYTDNCAPCHTAAGARAVRLFPRRTGGVAVQSDDATTLICTVLLGSRAVATTAALNWARDA